MRCQDSFMETKVGYFAQDDGTFPNFTLLKNCDIYTK